MKQKIATIFGASGFIGRHLIRRLTEKDFRIIVATRSPYLHGSLKTLGNPGQIDLEKINIFDEEKLRILIKNSHIVINLIGILYETKKQSFNSIHVKFPELLSSLCHKSNVEKLIHISAIGAKKNTNSKYLKTKFDGEECIVNNFKKFTIIRPSIVFGDEDKFFNKFASLSEIFPALPLIGGGNTKFQPIYVGDVAKSIVSILEKEKIDQNIYEIGGPQIYTFKELIEILLKVIKKKRFLISIPFSVAKYQAKVFELFPKPLLTTDQVEMLKYDNIITGNCPTLKELGIVPKNMEDIIPNYLYRFRKGGQFG